MGVIIKNSRAIVTGGAQGIGFEICRNLLIREAKTVAIFDIDESMGQESMEELNNKFGQGRSLFFVTDLTKADKFEENFKNAVEKLGGLDILINNAGILDDSNWSLMIDLNIKSVIHGMLLGINYMGKHKGRNGGTIINISSIAAFSSASYMPIYASTKAAIISASRNIGSYYETTGVAIKVMCPGRVDTYLGSNTLHRFMDFMNQEDMVEAIQNTPVIRTNDIAPEVMHLIEEPSNNAIWALAAKLPLSAVKFPEFANMFTPLKDK